MMSGFVLRTVLSVFAAFMAGARQLGLGKGGNGIGTIALYHKGEVVDVIRAENVGCEYGEFDKD